MASPILLAMIYLAFISLGLPDSTLGVAWPTFRSAVGAPLEAAGLIAVVLTVCSAISSMGSVYVTKRFGTGRVVAASCVLTALGLAGYSLAPSFAWVIVAALPLGFGQGAVDSSLNAHVAAHYASRHMNWLHASWGVGATLGPVVMSVAIVDWGSYRLGYRVISIVQCSLALIFILTLGLWRRDDERRGRYSSAAESRGDDRFSPTVGEASLRAAAAMQIAAYALYSACECSVIMWAASLLVEARGASAGYAGALMSLYFGGIMSGRVLTGFVSDRLGNRRMVWIGMGVATVGAALFAIRGPLWLSAPGLFLLGLGFAPIYPGLMHETPRRFGGDVYRTVIGFQMAAAMLGASFFPGLVGLAAARLGLEVLGPAVIGFIAALAAMIAMLDSLTRAPSPGPSA
ncbi:MAG: MFS transporter [Spirochaetae bacterium HGW-Spirochaetae-3]|jgi:fucose permease|nr:MAG: MFS transporter [Spirochaetae bacterium HGW-Spirochaetae-3]